MHEVEKFSKITNKVLIQDLMIQLYEIVYVSLYYT